MHVGYDFEWDPEKAEMNFRKHGVSFIEAMTAFGDPCHWICRTQTIQRASNGLSFSVRLIVIAFWLYRILKGHHGPG
jgi:uncharacterized DUF497 family protein